MQFIPVHTRIFSPPQDDIYKLFKESLPLLQEGDIVFVTSKIVSIHQGRCLKQELGVNKDDLIRQEAERYLPGSVNSAGVPLTIKEHTLIPAAGIDESNANGYYILWPKEVNRMAEEFCRWLKNEYSLKNLAVIITDSHTIPLRWGVMGISIGFYGLKPLKDYRGVLDIFGRQLKITQVNIVDAIAAMATLLMGEGAEQIPIVILRDTDFIEFTDKPTHKEFVIPADMDLYAPLLKIFGKKVY
jgi:dihydrofolate synthase / folylpolyglutamate synthase